MHGLKGWQAQGWLAEPMIKGWQYIGETFGVFIQFSSFDQAARLCQTWARQWGACLHLGMAYF